MPDEKKTASNIPGEDGSETPEEAAKEIKNALNVFIEKVKNLDEYKYGEYKYSEDEVGEFLFTEIAKAYSKEAIGIVLGEEKYKEYLVEYFNQMEFKGKSLDKALREALTYFRLPGEAQKIDRIIEAFAQSFQKDNPGKFANADAVYTLAFSIIMLNTDLHNPQVKKKMTKEQFIKNNRGMNNGKDYDPKMLGEIYDSISSQQINMTGEEQKAEEKRQSLVFSKSDNANSKWRDLKFKISQYSKPKPK